ncbi:hypothetical protein Tco_1050507 [Tanacetum coccineum]
MLGRCRENGEWAEKWWAAGVLLVNDLVRSCCCIKLGEVSRKVKAPISTVIGRIAKKNYGCSSRSKFMVGVDVEVGLRKLWSGDWIEVPDAVTSEEYLTGLEVLHRKTELVKFNGMDFPSPTRTGGYLQELKTLLRLLAEDLRCEDAPVSMFQLALAGSCSVIVLNA